MEGTKESKLYLLHFTLLYTLFAKSELFKPFKSSWILTPRIISANMLKGLKWIIYKYGCISASRKTRYLL